MNAYEYLQKLREALSVLPDDEIAQAMHYYEDYFLDAGDENAVIAELGSPEQVAQSILNEYTGMARRRPEHFDDVNQETIDGIPLDDKGNAIRQKPRKKGINPWVLLAIVLLGLPIGLPILVVLSGISIAVLAAIFGVGAALIAILIALPFALCIGGGLLFLFSFFLWAQPFSALATLGIGFVCAGAGFLLTLLVIKLMVMVAPPAVRALVSGLRWLLKKIRDMIRGVLQ
ncbi:MAG: DUF1700 domain-containing protein [Butyricicoccus pullicaecorum]|nr:DUF1700 domain-containing protein [Butyricicoccus pullicaecorum]MDO4668416.1 DUF1700 domain-containing protein [Butyricicoccus pullicaecorum]